MKNWLDTVKTPIAAVLPDSLKDRLRFQRYVRDTDVFLVGHPKSGNTWLAYMLAILVNRDRDGQINIGNVGEYVPVIHHSDTAIRHWTQLRPPRIFRNEAPLFPTRYPKTIYIARDPRAALVSYYHHCVHDTGRTDWPITDFVDEMISKGQIASLEPTLVRWDKQVDAWIDRAKRQPVLLVKYEDLLSNRRSCLVRLSEFLGLDTNDELLDLTVARGEFKSMRREEATFGAESYAGEKGAKGYFVRKGEAESWRKELPQASVEKIEDAFGPVMRKFGYGE
jgi:hypothetical protein